ncbi:hypothetical protein GYB22_01420 [bacterium]|nr:hypothetical protein [bacterium]
MKNLEKIILLILWVLCAISFTLTTFKGYSFELANWLGLAGLVLSLVLFYFFPQKKFEIMFGLLCIGSLNIFSFSNFFFGGFTFRIGKLMSPGIQFISFVLLLILILNRREDFRLMLSKIIGTSEDDQEFAFENEVRLFKKKFEGLSTEAIQIKMEQKLSPEAQKALELILKERENEAK